MRDFNMVQVATDGVDVAVSMDLIEQVARAHTPGLWNGDYRERLLKSKSGQEADEIILKQQAAEMGVAHSWLRAFFSTQTGVSVTFKSKEQ